MTHTHTRFLVLVVLTALVAGCAAGRAFRRGGSAARAGDWDNAVEHYRAAVQADPQSAEYKIALERAMISASLVHLDQARVLEARDQLDEALREYRRASEFDPPNRMIGGKVAELERRIRDQLEAARPKPSIQQLRETARQVGPPPLYNLTTVMEPLKFNQTNLRDILNSIGASTGINVTYESTFQDRPYTITLEGVTLEEALQQILSANTLFYKVVNQRTILVIPDNQAKRQQFEEQVLRTFYISHADPMEIQTMLNQIIRVPGQQVPPVVSASKTSNTLTIRATKSVADIIEQLVQQADKPRAEVIIDVQILEVNRTRTKQFGLDLGDYAISTVFSPESDPRGAAAPAAATGQTGTTGAARPPVFNANTISRGINTTDFYLSVPSAVVRFLESDSETKVIAKPQLRGAENVALKLNLGEEIPIPTTTFSPLAQGGPNFQPLTSFGYRSVGVNVEMTPRVTYEGDVILDPLFVESSTLGSGIVIAGQELPSFGSRKVTTALRLREGESSLLAGLLREDQRKAAAGFPGLLGIPIIRQLFSSNDQNIQQTDIVMLLTPRIVRTHELTAQDVSPIYIGTQSNLGLSGPPPLIAPVSTPPAATPGAPVTPTAAPPAAPPAGPPAKPDAGPSTAAPGTKGVPAAPAATPRETGQVVVTPPRTDFQVGGGPYIVPISITGVSQLSRVALTVSYNPATLRVRTLQEGSFMRTGSVPAVFTSQPDAAGGRLDIAIVRTGDATGVAGTGLLAAVLFDAIGAGPANITVTGTAASPAGSAVPLQFAAVPPVTVK